MAFILSFVQKSVSTDRPCHPYFVNTRSVHVHDFKYETIPFQLLSTTRNTLQAVEYQTGQRMISGSIISITAVEITQQVV